MRCIYCGDNKMQYDDELGKFNCVKCNAVLDIFQNPFVKTKDDVTNNIIKNKNGQEYIGKDLNYTTSGIGATWIRGII